MSDSHNNQMKLIHIAKRDLKLADEDYRHIVSAVGGSVSGSAKDLTERGADLVLAHFKALGWIPSKLGGQALVGLKSRRANMATQKQLALLLSLWSEAARTPTEAAFNQFLQSRFDVSHYRFLSIHKVSGVKAALDSMIAQKQSAPEQADAPKKKRGA